MSCARNDAIARFLECEGWGDAVRSALAGDASFRRYERLEGPRGRAVLMDAPPENEEVRPFVRIARYLVDQGYSAPRILAADEAAGLLLLEDLGDDLFTRLLAEDGTNEPELYAAAIDLLADLHQKAPPLGLAPYDEAPLQAEADLFVDWYLPRKRRRPTPESERAAYRALWRRVYPLAAEAKPVLVLRDYHADNLIWLPERQGVARVGLLDFQDALLGARAYDLVSLLEDARRDVAPQVVRAGIERYLKAAGGLDRARFLAAYAVLGAQRNVKILGIFTRLLKRDGKPQYLRYLPRVWRLLEGDLKHPALQELAHWFDHAVPPQERER